MRADQYVTPEAIPDRRVYTGSRLDAHALASKIFGLASALDCVVAELRDDEAGDYRHCGAATIADEIQDLAAELMRRIDRGGIE